MPLKPFVTSHPGKFLFTLWTLCLNAVRLPLWMIYFIPTFLRQNPKWSYEQAVRVRLTRVILQYIADVEARSPMLLDAGREANRFVKIPPGASNKYIGATGQDPEIKPTTIGGTWYPSCPLPATVGNVVLHFHGGAYVIGDGRTQDAGFAAKTILSNTSTEHVFCPQYRLASHPGGRFPASLQDAITSLLYLTETLKVPAEKLTISGDSAGGHLCLSLLRYIHDNPEAGLPNPACALLWSPWVNPARSLEKGAFDSSPHGSTDYLNDSFGAWGARSLTPSKASGMTLEHPNICIPGNAFATPTPLFFTAGECEVLFHDVVKTYEEFKAIPGNKVQLEIDKNAVHDIIMIGPMVGFRKEAALAAQKAGKFIKSHL